ncbi:hypothetical protein HUG20_12785 [Salicibibacter cibi]|uniref:Uncharacterized protein n=1 Tax=Salicibibacter cibi TaxID=2743001 RepID=A0A7T6ZBY3_9BACI|nr:hypothetical protein HUG20_12785 [Salicibibacter cibi]
MMKPTKKKLIQPGKRTSRRRNNTIRGVIKQLIFGDETKELGSTRRILERLPEKYMSWKPHDKSIKLEGLATHLINLLNCKIANFQYNEFHLATVPQKRQACSYLSIKNENDPLWEDFIAHIGPYHIAPIFRWIEQGHNLKKL